MMDVKLKYGDKVLVRGGDMRKFLGVGIFIGLKPSDVEVRKKIYSLDMPKFRMANGKTIYGCECWWITLKEIEKDALGKQLKIGDFVEDVCLILKPTKKVPTKKVPKKYRSIKGRIFDFVTNKEGHQALIEWPNKDLVPRWAPQFLRRVK